MASESEILDNDPQDLSSSSKELNGILVTYIDDELNDCVKSALRRKSRVRYKCMDAFSNLFAFGTSGGAIYLFKLKSISHSSCSLSLIIPSDQGSIEVIKFLPNSETDNLLIAIGTSRGSIVVFKLSQLPGDENPTCIEIYKAESFTNNCAIKLIECDQDILDLKCPFTKLYVCDSANRLYVLENSTINASKQTLRLFYSNRLPSLILSVNDSKINQISVHRSRLILSTDETSRLFNEHTNQITTIGKKKRKDGFYGSCFFNPSHNPSRILRLSNRENQTTNLSTWSIADSEDLLIFVARPMFRLWQVNRDGEVKFTHQFEPSMTSTRLVELLDEPLKEGSLDDPTNTLNQLNTLDEPSDTRQCKSGHFQKLVQMYSSTLGNLLLSHTRHDLFVIDPMKAMLLVHHHQEDSIVQVCCSENEIFIWSIDSNDERQFHVRRLILLAPTQLVLELHRLRRYNTLIMFVQLFSDLFRRRMALPLSGINIITTEGGLLRNIILNAWDSYKNNRSNYNLGESNSDLEACEEFKSIVDEIVHECNQLRNSFDDMAGSRLLYSVNCENFDRLCTEPYASLVSLEVSIKDLHTKHVVHFNENSVNRHKSLANLSRSIVKLKDDRRMLTKSNSDLANQALATKKSENIYVDSVRKSCNLEVTVERPSRKSKVMKSITNIKEPEKFNSPEVERSTGENGQKLLIEQSLSQESTCSSESSRDGVKVESSNLQALRCSNCKWPLAKSHQVPMHSNQLIQLRWIEGNLMSRFEENLPEIEALAFEHGLWHIFLKCLAFKNQTDEYISCCMLLDDIRLLDIEQFIIVYCGEFEIMDRLLVQLKKRIDLITEFNHKYSVNEGANRVCLNCGCDLKPLRDRYPIISDCDKSDDVEESHDSEGDKFSFNLMNLIELFMMRRNADPRKIISCLLKHPDLLNSSKIPSTFYLKAITMTTLKANQSPINRARLRAFISK